MGEDDSSSSSCDYSSHPENSEHSRHDGANNYKSPSKSLSLSCSYPSVDERLENAVVDNCYELENSFFPSNNERTTIHTIQSTTSSNEDLAKSLSMIKKHAEQLGLDPTELFHIQ